MAFLYALFHLYAAFVQWFQTQRWYISRTLKVSKVALHPYPHHSFLAYPTGFVSKLVYIQQPLRHFKRSFEYKVFQFIEQNLDEGDKAIDIGANVGIITMFMSQIVGKKGHIFAIEASPSNSIILQQNINLNNLDNITLINRAVAEKERQVFMLSPQNTYNDALLVMNESPKPLSEEVQALPFDEIAKEWQIGKSKLIKVDIEGAEIFFFEGAQNYLKMYKPILIFETLQSYTRRFDYSVVDVLLLLRGFGYHVEQIDIETWIALYKNQHNER